MLKRYTYSMATCALAFILLFIYALKEKEGIDYNSENVDLGSTVDSRLVDSDVMSASGDGHKSGGLSMSTPDFPCEADGVSSGLDFLFAASREDSPEKLLERRPTSKYEDKSWDGREVSPTVVLRVSTNDFTFEESYGFQEDHLRSALVTLKCSSRPIATKFVEAALTRLELVGTCTSARLKHKHRGCDDLILDWTSEAEMYSVRLICGVSKNAADDYFIQIGKVFQTDKFPHTKGGVKGMHFIGDATAALGSWGVEHQLQCQCDSRDP